MTDDSTWQVELWVLICFEIMYQCYLYSAHQNGLKGVSRETFLKVGDMKGKAYKEIIAESLQYDDTRDWFLEALNRTIRTLGPPKFTAQ